MCFCPFFRYSLSRAVLPTTTRTGHLTGFADVVDMGIDIGIGIDIDIDIDIDTDTITASGSGSLGGTSTLNIDTNIAHY